MVFDIQRFSIHDGPGIRTTVFLKGCPLRCVWCHNPEGLDPLPEVFYQPQKCIGCGYCVRECPRDAHALAEGVHTYDRANCTRCGACARACCALALEMTGREMTTEAVIEEVLRDQPFYANSGGGMTLSGGEPFFQPEFALDLLRAGKEAGLHICVETSGACARETLLEGARHTDIFLYDIKETNPVRHRECTGADNALILSNLRALDEAEAHIVLRCPVIEGLNDREDHFAAIAALAGSLRSVERIDVEPYHPMGISKCERLGKRSEFERAGFTPAEKAKEWVQTIGAKTGIPVEVS